MAWLGVGLAWIMSCLSGELDGKAANALYYYRFLFPLSVWIGVLEHPHVYGRSQDSMAWRLSSNIHCKKLKQVAHVQTATVVCRYFN